MLILHAPNIHQGGGRALLLAVLAALPNQTRVHLDRRMSLPKDLPDGLDIHRFEPSFAGRWAAERALQAAATPQDNVLCFGNLPPIFALPAQVQVFLQNRYLLTTDGLSDMPWRIRARLWVERHWLRRALRNADIIVQTPTMADLVAQHLGRTPMVRPFRAPMPEPAMNDTGPSHKSLDLLYVASGEPHKNHATLIAAWGLLAAQGQTPSLGLTLAEKQVPALAAHTKALNAKGADIRFLGPCPPEAIAALYTSARALIYPSRFESFGLPLLEAAEAGLPILASERDYVRDVVLPAGTFDPSSARSIARAVLRFLGTPEQPPRVDDAPGFVATLRAKQ